MKKFEQTIDKNLSDNQLKLIFDGDENSLTFIKDKNDVKNQKFSPTKKNNKILPSPIKFTKNFQNKLEEEYFCEYEYDSQISKSLKMEELNFSKILIIYKYSDKAARKESNSEKNIQIEYICVDCKKTRNKKTNNQLNTSNIFFNVFCQKVESDREKMKEKDSLDSDEEYFNDTEDEIGRLNRNLEKNKNKSIGLEDAFNYQWHCLNYVENIDDMQIAISKFINFEK